LGRREEIEEVREEREPKERGRFSLYFTKSFDFYFENYFEFEAKLRERFKIRFSNITLFVIKTKQLYV
jgi:hypothetical protein